MKIKNKPYHAFIIKNKNGEKIVRVRAGYLCDKISKTSDLQNRDAIPCDVFYTKDLDAVNYQDAKKKAESFFHNLIN